jgi:hypothetical protein
MKISRRNLLSGLTAGAALPWLGPSAARAAATSSLPAVAAPHPLDENHPASHVGNLIGPIARIRDAYGWATESFTSARYRAADHPAWRSKMLDQVFAAMRYAPAQADFAAETVEKVDCGPFIREKIYFNTTPELRVPAYVLVPKVRRGRVHAGRASQPHGLQENILRRPLDRR